MGILGNYSDEEFAGVVYIMVNPTFPNFVKIGYADDVAKRLRLLSNISGLSDLYHVYATYKVKRRLADKRLHDLIDVLGPDLRHTRNREFYEMSAERAYGILSAIAELNGSEDLLELNPLGDAFFGGENVESVGNTPINDANERMCKAQPLFDFEEFGIKQGSQLVFYNAYAKIVIPEIRAMVQDRQHIIFGGEVTSLSKAAQRLLKLKSEPSGMDYWMYKGRRLVDIYQEKYLKLGKSKR